jgi:protein-L-isoaspartate(D-aspartate) O-methyltransferase
MPVCPECGIDVAEEGLCAECKRESAEKRGENSRSPQVVLLVVVGLLVFAAAFFIGRSFGLGSADRSSGSTQPARESGESADSKESSDPKDTITTNSSEQPARVELEPIVDLRGRPEGPPYETKEEYLEWMLANTDQEEKYLLEKWERYKWVISWSSSPSLTHPRVVQGFLKTPREYFCREWNLPKAYAHAYLSIGYGQTISGPEIVSRMTNALNPQIDHKVLEIGTGSGYQAAFLAELSNFVYTIEIVEPLAQVTDQIYRNLESRYPQYKNVLRKIEDGYYGWEEHAPFDRIIVTCGIDHIPPPLLKQLSPDGIMVIPVGPPSGQTILKVTKRVGADGTVTLEREDIYKGTPTKGDVFVPFTAKGGGVHSKERDNP